MKHKNIIKGMRLMVFVLLTVALTGCKKDWLDVKSDKSLAIPSSLKDFASMMDNSEIMNVNTPCLGEIASDLKELAPNRWTGGAMDDAAKNGFIWSNGFIYSMVWDWDKSYQRIFYCNLVIEGLDKMDKNNLDLIEWKQIKGNALFHRAKNFHDLGQIWAQPYDVSTFNIDLAMPMRIESDINILSKRSTVKQVYEQIIQDLLEAKDLLPVTAVYRTRGSKAACLAMLSRVYLSMQDYKKAGAYADSSLLLNSNLLDFKQLNASATFPIVRFNSEVLFHSTMVTSMSSAANAFLIEKTFYDLYNSNDLRKSIYYNKNGDIISFKGSYYGASRQLFSGLANDEILLNRAECLARVGNTTGAMKDLNTLLQTRFSKPYIELTALNSEAALKLILDERKKELIWRGTRWMDLRRLNSDSRFATTISRTVEGITYTLEPNSFKYTFPLPIDIMQRTEMPQTVGW